MRVIIAGQSGTRKRDLAENLKKYALEQRDIGLTHRASAREVDWFEVESPKWLGVDFYTFLTNYDEFKQREEWAAALQKITDHVNRKHVRDVFLLIHATGYRDGRFFSPVSWDGLLLFQPDCIVTLIDDIYDIWQRIEEGPYDTHLSLEEILNWRSAEILATEKMAEELRLDPDRLGNPKVPPHLKKFFGPPLPFYIMAVKHPIQTFYQLIFEQQKRQVVYASFPITRTRNNSKRREDIDLFRQQLRETGAIVIDPLTIDELQMADKDPSDPGGERFNPQWLNLTDDQKYREYQATRWPVPEPAIEPPHEYTKNPFRDLSDKQIQSVVKGIIQDVIARDVRLVSRSERLVAYRPFYPKEGDEIIGPIPLDSTDGVTREIDYALSLERAVWAFHPKCDYHPRQDTAFFSQATRWKRVRRFPKESQLKDLPNNDFSGFKELLAELPREMKIAKLRETSS